MDESTDDDVDESEDGSPGRGELKGYTVGLHSPFGIVGQLKEKRGYTHRQIMWGSSWLLYTLELADQPRYVRNKKIATFDNIEQIKQQIGTGTDRHKDEAECQ